MSKALFPREITLVDPTALSLVDDFRRAMPQYPDAVFHTVAVTPYPVRVFVAVCVNKGESVGLASYIQVHNVLIGTGLLQSWVADPFTHMNDTLTSNVNSLYDAFGGKITWDKSELVSHIASLIQAS